MRSYTLVEALSGLPDMAKIGVLDRLGQPVELRLLPAVEGSGFTHMIAAAPDQGASKDVLTLGAFQQYAMHSAAYPGHGSGSPGAMMTPIGGLAGEAGAMLHDWMRIVRGEEPMKAETKLELAGYLSKLLWYAAALAEELRIPLSQLGEQSIRDARARTAAKQTAANQSDLLPSERPAWWNEGNN